VPIDPGLPQERREYILKNSKVGIVLTQSWLNEQLSWPEGVIRLCINEQDLSNESKELLESVQTPDDLAYLIYTSGSTGVPKGVMINHRGAVNTIIDINQRFDVSPSDRVLALSSLSFDLSVYDIFGTLAAGGTIVIPDANGTKDPAHWAQLMVQQQVNVWNSVPALMQMLVNYTAGCSQLLPKSLRLVMLSGDWLPLSLPEQIRSLCENVQLVSLGGATEASIWSILYPIEQVESTWKSIPYGRPMANQRFYVLNEALEPCPVWTPGQLYIGGIGLAKGYWRNEEKTNASFIIHPQTQERLYKTGDLGRYLPDGNIEFIGREDFQVKINGHRIELGEIEATLQEHSAIKEVVVTASGESRENKQLIAYLVPEQEEASNLYEVESTDYSKFQQLWKSLVQAGLQQAQHDFWHIDLQTFSLLWKYQDHLYAISLCRALRKLNIYNSSGEKYSVNDLISRCRIAPRYRRWLYRALKVLVQEGWLQQDGEIFESIIGLPTIVSEELSEEVQAKLSQSNELTKVWLDLIDIDTAENLGNIITENIHSAEFYAKEEVLVDIYQRMFGYCHAIVREIIRVVVQALEPEKQLRILEVGAGYGSCTMHVLPLLPPEQTTYAFTDISHFFLERAKESFADYSFVNYGLLDLDRNPYAQGYELHSFDIIIAASMLHDARNIEKALEHILSLLAPNGLLLVIEETKFHRSFDLHMGLQQGFDVFEDEKLRSNHPLLSREQWQKILTASGFEDSAILNQPGYVSDFIGLDVLVARGPSSVKRFKSVELRNFLYKKMPEYMIPFDFILLDALPLTPNGKLDRLALPTVKSRDDRPQLKTADLLPKTETEQLIAAVWQEVLKVENIGIHENFFELGGDSLLLVKTQVKLKEVLGREVSIVEMFKYPTMESFAKYLSQSDNTQTGAKQGRARAQHRTTLRTTRKLQKKSSKIHKI
ncbi:MAG: amino acid adenylation domain-containing protein, partial [Moorea sp. SIO2I5]|nr:amino acid adenylation domain-containing protein [Moorena sp. SIO2I5]